jgi:hypothetical protein
MLFQFWYAKRTLINLKLTASSFFTTFGIGIFDGNLSISFETEWCVITHLPNTVVATTHPHKLWATSPPFVVLSFCTTTICKRERELPILLSPYCSPTPPPTRIGKKKQRMATTPNDDSNNNDLGVGRSSKDGSSADDREEEDGISSIEDHGGGDRFPSVVGASTTTTTTTFPTHPIAGSTSIQAHGTTDEEFMNLIATTLQKDPLSKEYPDIFAKAPAVITNWRRRYRGNVAVWKRLFHMDHIVKEFIEAVPVIDAVYKMIEHSTRPIIDPNDDGGTTTTTPTVPPNRKQFTIIDLASGKGYLSMILAELLPPDRVFRIVLMDKAWPMRNAQPTSHNINWEHIYGNIVPSATTTSVTPPPAAMGSTGGGGGGRDEHKNDHPDNQIDEAQQHIPICIDCTTVHDDVERKPKTLTVDGTESSTATTTTTYTPTRPAAATTTTTTATGTYYDTWPIALDTSKQDLKHSRQLQKIREHYLSNPDHPVIILAIHLCGTLSLKAIQLFNDNPANVHFLALKPCCLPGMVHAKRKEVFHLGRHTFPADDVCIHGKWKKNMWRGGPPRKHIQQRFQRWANHLYCGILDRDDDDPTNNNKRDNDNDDGVSGVGTNTQTTPCDGDLSSSVLPPPASSSLLSKPKPQPQQRPIRKIHTRVMVQQGGGFQNDFLFAERYPSTGTIWEELERRKVVPSE